MVHIFILISQISRTNFWRVLGRPYRQQNNVGGREVGVLCLRIIDIFLGFDEKNLDQIHGRFIEMKCRIVIEKGGGARNVLLSGKQCLNIT